MRTVQVLPLALLLPSLCTISSPFNFSLLPHLSLPPQAALVETDSRSDDLEKRNHLLEGEVADLRQSLKEQSQADEHIMALMNAKTKEWQVSCDPRASSFPSPSLRPFSLFLFPFYTPFLLSSFRSCLAKISPYDPPSSCFSLLPLPSFSSSDLDR